MHKNKPDFGLPANTPPSQKNASPKLLPAIFIGAAAGFFLCLGLLVWLVYAFFFGSAPTVYKNAADYGKCWDNTIHSGLLLFPDNINPSAEDTEFYYYWRDTFNFPTAEIHLACTYTPNDYAQEISRIQSVRKQIGGQVKQVYFDDCSDFSYPAYVAVSKNHIWEYALLMEESCTIHYIFTEYCSSENVHFDASYLPANFDDTSRLAFGKEFSIYEYPIYENGEITALEGDYSRTAVVPKTQGHYVDAGKYTLQVATEMNADGIETIRGCTLFYLDGSTEKMWEFSDLNGTLYRNLSLNKDRSQAIITWEDHSGEHESVFDIRERKFLTSAALFPFR